jgi:hypothetical protein
MQLRTHASFTKWWSADIQPCEIISYSPLQPQVRVSADGTQLAFVPESVSMELPVPLQQLQQWAAAQQAAAPARIAIFPAAAAGNSSSAEPDSAGAGTAVAGSPPTPKPDHNSEIPGVWGVDRFLSLLLGEVPRLRDAPGGYGPKGSGFIDRVDIPEEVETAWAWLAGRYPQLLRA